MKRFSLKKKVVPNFDFDNISLDKKFVFIHVPKNAGTSIYKSLGMQTSRHYTVDEYISMLSKELYEDLFSFAFVRNPFSRFLSLYNYARMEESYYHSAVNPESALFGKHMDYDMLKNASIPEAAQLLIEGKLVHNPPHNQWKPQSFWLKESERNINVKYIGRFEDLQRHMQHIYDKIGLHFSHQLPLTNTSNKTSNNYKKYIDADTRQLLEMFYKEDLESFDYDF